jgi:hypothetical protein
MADNLTTPIPDDTELASKDIGGVQYPKNLLTDHAGADVLGTVTESPTANTVLGRLKAAVDGLVEVAALLQGELTVAGDFYPETQPVSATALPLPTGAATAEKQDAVKASIDATALVGIPFPITPHASNALARPTKAISVQVAGTLVFRPPSGSEDITISVPAGLLPIPATHIRATSTATGLTGY